MTFGSQTIEKELRIGEAIACRSPTGAVAIDSDAPFAALIGAAVSAMHETIHEKQRITCFQVDGHGAVQGIHTIEFCIVAGVGVGQIRFVAARNRHGGPIARSDIGQCQDDIDLAVTKYAVLVNVLVAQRRLVAAGVDRMVAAERRMEAMASSMKRAWT